MNVSHLGWFLAVLEKYRKRPSFPHVVEAAWLKPGRGGPIYLLPVKISLNLRRAG